MSVLKGVLKAMDNPYATIAKDGLICGDISGYVDSGVYTLNALISGKLRGGFPKGKVVALAGEKGTGKGLLNGTKILTPDGNKTSIEDLKEGDMICNTYGGYSSVTGVFPQGKKEIYEMTFSDGSVVLCDSSHRWTTIHWNTGNIKTYSVDELIDIDVLRYHKPTERSPQTSYSKFYIPDVSPIEFKEKPIPLDPYTLGAWLGDGCRCNSQITNMDEEVWDNIPYDKGMSQNGSSGKATTRTILGISKELHYLGLRNGIDKFIPNEYLFNSVDIRTRLLQGLMDTDGYISESGMIEFSSSDRPLIDGMFKLVRSLGGVSKGIRTKKIKGYKDHYRLIFQLKDVKIFNIDRKLKRCREYEKVNGSRVYITGLKKTDDTNDTTCISVDSNDHLFLVDNYIPTHNTFILLKALKEYLDADKENEVIFFESEGALNKPLLIDRGLDVNRVSIVPISTVEELRHQALVAMDYMELLWKESGEYPKIVMCLDSLGMLGTDFEVNTSRTGENKADMGKRAQLIKSVFRNMTLKLSLLQIPMIITNHTYKGMGKYDPTKMSGGQGLEFAASIIIFLSKSKDTEGKDKIKNLIGNNITFIVHKGRMTIEGSKAIVNLNFKGGIGRYNGLVDMFVKAKIIQKSGSWYAYKEERIGQGEKQVYANLPNFVDDEMLDQLDPYIEERFCYGAYNDEETVEI